jgi:RNA polymerase sigma factor (sigma-70 family)
MTTTSRRFRYSPAIIAEAAHTLLDHLPVCVLPGERHEWVKDLREALEDAAGDYDGCRLADYLERRCDWDVDAELIEGLSHAGAILLGIYQTAMLEHRRLAIKIAFRRMKRDPMIRRLDTDDITQAAMLGLASALQIHDPAKGRLGTILHYTVWRALQEAAQHAGVVSIPGALARKNRQGEETLRRARKALRSAISLDWDTGEDNPIRDVLCRPVLPEEIPEHDERYLRVLKVMRRMSPRHRLAVELRYIQGRSLADAGQVMGVCKERVRQLSQVGLRKIREAIARQDREARRAGSK